MIFMIYNFSNRLPDICLLEKLIIILLSQHNTISVLKIKYNFFNWKIVIPADKYLFKLTTETLTIRQQNNSNDVLIVNFE